jgi:pilus assembly protein CpaF
MSGFEMILPFLKPIEHLIRDDSVSEIMINGPSRVFIERRGFLQQEKGSHADHPQVQSPFR